MAIDNKYGKVTTEFGEIGEDEPVVVFRARDGELWNLLGVYHRMCQTAGSPQHHLDLIDQSRKQIQEWQSNNQDLVRVPNSNAYLRRIGGGTLENSAPHPPVVHDDEIEMMGD